MARSLAFWFKSEEQNNEVKPDAELHFNYWLLNSNQINYLDVGVKFAPKLKFDSINFYLPFSYEAITYDGTLGKVVCDNIGLIPAIFNSQVENITPNQINGSYEIDFANDDKLRFFTQLEEETNVSPGGVEITQQNTDSEKGIELSFPASLFKDRPKDRDCYFRFRVIVEIAEKQQSISRLSRSKGARFTGHLETTELIDFRINELRNVPAKIKTKLTKYSPINSVHFFLIREADSEYKISHQDFSRCRLLESELWDDYLETKNRAKQKISEQMLIYHWKDKAKEDKNKIMVNIDHFSAFAKFTKWEVTPKLLLSFICIIILLGCLGSLSANIIWEFFNKDVQSQQIELVCDKDIALNSTVMTCSITKKSPIIQQANETQATGGK